MKILPTSIWMPFSFLAAILPQVAWAGVDQPWQELESGGFGDVGGGFVLLAVIAIAIHLIEKGEFFGFLRDIAKGVSFIATMYLMVFWFLVCIVGVALALQAVGFEKSTSGWIAFPAGLVLAYKIFSLYEDWRAKKAK